MASLAVIPLADAVHQPLAIVGGKAAALSRLIKFGAPVPPGFIVPPTTNLEAAKNELTSAAAGLKPSSLAVRSSAAGEDSKNQSWAGQFETFLYVSPDDVSARIADCRASGHSARVRAYAADADQATMPMAVIVQAMVPAVSAGVLFTANPITKDRSEIMVEAVWGLGELLVSGLVTPDNFQLEKSTGRLKRQTIALKTVKMVRESHGPTEQSVPAALQNQPALTPAQLSELTTTARNLETKFQHPLDIEFAFDPQGQLFILQARPITTL